MILADALQFSIRWSNEIPLREKGTLLNLPRSLCVASLLSWIFSFFSFVFLQFLRSQLTCEDNRVVLFGGLITS